MSIQFQYFQIAPHGDNEEVESLNRFLRSVQVLHVRHEFLNQAPGPGWCVLVEYLDKSGTSGGQGRKGGGRTRKDYREILSPEDFALYAMLRDWRKERGTAEQIPVYTIMTNEQMAQIARRRPASLAQLQEIGGIGEARTSRYGNDLLALLQEQTRHQPHQEDQKDAPHTGSNRPS